VAILWRKPVAKEECRNGVVIPLKDQSEVFFQITAFYELPDKTVAHLFRRRHAAYHSGRLFDKQDDRASAMSRIFRMPSMQADVVVRPLLRRKISSFFS
jgi:hypothetical protein